MNITHYLKVFARVAEGNSITQAEEQLKDWPGTRLLHRTTRRVHLAQDGRVCQERCKHLLSDLDELQSLFPQTGGAPLSKWSGAHRHAQWHGPHGCDASPARVVRHAPATGVGDQQHQPARGRSQRRWSGGAASGKNADGELCQPRLTGAPWCAADIDRPGAPPTPASQPDAGCASDGV